LDVLVRFLAYLTSGRDAHDDELRACAGEEHLTKIGVFGSLLSDVCLIGHRG